jgi:hypothetical protein
MCSTHGWSILHSAPSNATLAGVLAGFAFTAGVIYVGRQQWADWVSPDVDYVKVCPDLPVAPD